MKALPNIAGRCARVLVLLAAAGPVAGAEPELDRELRDLNAESAKKWLRFAEKMLQQKNARLALRAVEIIESIDPQNREAGRLREDPRLLLQSIRDQAVLLLPLDREKEASKAKDLVRDRSGTGNDGTIRGARFDLGVAGDGLKFEGPMDSVHGSFPVRRFPAKDSPWTVSLWIRVSSGGGSLFSMSAGEETAALFRLRLGKDGELVADNGERSKVAGRSPLGDGQWHHAAVVFSPGAPEPLAIHLDGLRDAAGSFRFSPGENGRLSWHAGGGASEPSIRGQLDEIGLFLRVLTEKEIGALYRLGKSGKGLAD